MSDIDAAIVAVGGAAGLRMWVKVKVSAWREQRGGAPAPQCRGKRRPEPEPKQPPLRVRPRVVHGALVSVTMPAHRPPRLPRDPQDDQRDPEPDQGVREVEAHSDDRGAGDHAEADEGVGAGVVAVGD